ncbi:MAG: hypothetical protein AAF236_02235 [Verrucomicrobiota bacterium]
MISSEDGDWEDEEWIEEMLRRVEHDPAGQAIDTAIGFAHGLIAEGYSPIVVIYALNFAAADVLAQMLDESDEK